MKTLIIPDIHNKTEKAEKIIQKENPDRTVFLGDYFDSFGEGIEFAQQTALWLKSSLQQPNRVHLIGNHDLSYQSNGIFQCSGFNSFKLWAIGRILQREDWNRMRFHEWVGDWLCTHAGVSRQFFDYYSKSRDIKTFMKEEELEAAKFLKSGRYHPFFHCTEARGGVDKYPGIL
ncbi:MAG: metallophosphoesterase, partial [Nitrosopumilaceae archaeon]